MHSFRTELSRTARLALPVIGGQIATVGMNFLDTVMSGKVGPVALGAIAVGTSFFGSVMLFMIGVMMALPPIVAQLDGADERERIAPVFRQSLWVAVGLMLLAFLVMSQAGRVLAWAGVEEQLVPTVLGYLKALRWGVPGFALLLAVRFLCEGLGRTRATLYVGLFGLALNFVGNYVLIYGHFGFPALGAIGCGYATSIVWTLQFLALAGYAAVQFGGLKLFERLDPLQLPGVAELLRIGLPIGVSLFMEVSMFSVVALLMGSLGVEIVAAHQIALNFAAMTFMVPLGLSMAITIRVGNAVGRRDPEGVVRAGWAGMALALGTQLVSSCVMIFLPRTVASIYTDDVAVIDLAVRLLFLAAIFQLSDGIQVCSAGGLRGLKDTKVPMLITIFSYWAVGTPLGYWLGFPLGMGAPGLWIGLIAGLSTAAVLLGIRFWRSARIA